LTSQKVDGTREAEGKLGSWLCTKCCAKAMQFGKKAGQNMCAVILWDGRANVEDI
jgi:hypothetical protein